MPGVVARIENPAPTKVEQRARQRKQFEFILIAMVVYYLRYEWELWRGAHAVKKHFGLSMVYFLNECKPEDVAIDIDESCSLFLMDLILAHMTEQEYQKFINGVTESMKTIDKLGRTVGQMTDSEERKKCAKEVLTRELDKICPVIMSTIQRDPELKILFEQMFFQEVKFDMELFTNKKNR